MDKQVYVRFTGHNLADHTWLKALARREKRTMPQQILILIRQAQAHEARAVRELNEEAVRDALLERLLAEDEARERA